PNPKFYFVSVPVNEAIVMADNENNAYMMKLSFIDNEVSKYTKIKNVLFIVPFNSQGKLKIIDREYQVSGIVKIQFS
ncbi:hypothetical protein, partial [Caldisericum sp.]|uniref:hypothetical protein n=1 Tax=Caldisericum sp. TaxID=2499687 RepID=UPI003D111529